MTDNQSAPTNNAARKKVLTRMATVFILVGIAWAAYWLIFDRFAVSTDDAYVDGNVIPITSRVSGTIIAIRVDDTDAVHEGEILVQLDPTDAEVALQQAEAHLAQAVRSVQQLFDNVTQTEATVAVRRENLQRLKDDWVRRKELLEKKVYSKEDAEHSLSEFKQAQSELDQTLAQLSAANAQTANTGLEKHPNVLQAAALFRKAYLDLKRCTVRAPTSGYIAKRSAQVGQRITSDSPLMALIPLNQLWVEANLKEDELTRVRIGQQASMSADLYGSNVVYSGTVIGIASGTGSVFSLLPPQNASGNWIKIVQRLPVRISLDPSELDEHPLRVGLSMRVNIKTRDISGPMLAAEKPSKSNLFETKIYSQDEKEADEWIHKIIETNRPPQKS